MRKTPFIALLVLVAPILTRPAVAQVDMNEAQAACQGDVLRLCPAYILDRSAIIACMHRQRASLSPACGAIFDKGTRAQAGRPATAVQ